MFFHLFITDLVVLIEFIYMFSGYEFLFILLINICKILKIGLTEKNFLINLNVKESTFLYFQKKKICLRASFKKDLLN